MGPSPILTIILIENALQKTVVVEDIAAATMMVIDTATMISETSLIQEMKEMEEMIKGEEKEMTTSKMTTSITFTK